VINVARGVIAGVAVDGSFLIDRKQILPAQPIGLFGGDHRADVLNYPPPGSDG
jgi:hypothetical protein